VGPQCAGDRLQPRQRQNINGVFGLGDVPAPEETTARSLIASFYADILGRGPEPRAIDAWYHRYFAYLVSSSIDVRFAPREMARLFFVSAEYQARAEP
jgi:hypothetical protein